MVALAARARGWRPLESVARAGYAVRGGIYVLIGGLALVAALGQGGGTHGSEGILQIVLRQPQGKVLLGLIGAGLVAYAFWRSVQAIFDADRHGHDAKALTIRAALLVSAIIHLGLAFAAFGLALGWGGGDDRGERGWTAWLLLQPFGAALAAGVGAAVIGAGLALAWKGWRASFEKRFELDPEAMRWASPICRFGLVARGLTFVIIGGFLAVAAWTADADRAIGLKGTLELLQQQPYGWVLLAIVAAGLTAFGAYSFIEAGWRRIAVR